MPDFIPSKDAEFLAWAQNFSTYLSAHATDMGVAVEKAAAIANKVQDFDRGFGSHNTAQQSARSARVIKDNTRDSGEDAIRTLVRQLQVSETVTDEQREGLGIPLRRQENLSYSTPPSRPIGSIDTSARLVHKIKYWDQNSASKARPDGVMGCEIWLAVKESTDPTPLDPGLYQNLGLDTASPFVINHEAASIGKMAHYILRWINRDGTKGLWSEIISATIVG